MTDWNPELYNRFKAQRGQPFKDLISLLPPRIGGSMLDLGCGDGRLTREAAVALDMDDAVGLDVSENMLADAQEGDDGNVAYRWKHGDIGEALSSSDTYQLVLSNAALQFVDDHATVFGQILDRVAPGGWLAVHIPYNHIARTHLLLDAASTSEGLSTHFEGFSHKWPQERPEVYARALKNAGFEFTSVQLRTYRHALEGVEQIVDWIRGGAARPYLEHLDESHHEAFFDKYARLIGHAYPKVDDGGLRLLDYTRLLMVGRRPPE